MTRASPAPRGRVPVLHVVTDDAVLARARFVDGARAAMEVGGPHLALHLRGHATPGGRIFTLASELRSWAQSYGSLLVVNDRVDVALAAGLHAVQLGERSLPVADARRLLGPEVAVGASIHDPMGAAAAARDGSAWLFVGTLYSTPSHPEHPGAGCEALVRVAEAVKVPLVGIGGITVGRVAEVRDHGAHGVAVIRGVWNAPDPVRAVRDYLVALA